MRNVRAGRARTRLGRLPPHRPRARADAPPGAGSGRLAGPHIGGTMSCRMLSSAMKDRQGAGSKISFAICLGVGSASAKTHFCAGPCSLYCCSKEQCERHYFPERSVPKDEASPHWVTSFDVRTAPQFVEGGFFTALFFSTAANLIYVDFGGFRRRL